MRFFRTNRAALLCGLMYFTPASADSPSPAPAKPAITRVESFPGGHPQAGLGNYVRLRGDSLDAFLREKPEAAEKIRLFIDGLPVKGSRPEIAYEDGRPSLVFRLARDSASAAIWKAMYQFPRDHARNVTLSAGYEEKGPLPTREKKNFQFLLMHKGRHIAAWVVMILLLIVFLALAWKSDILRDDSNPHNDGGGKPPKPPFSLSRTQLAFWSILVSFSFLYIWAVTGELSTLTGSTLILLGISVGTTAGSLLVDKNQDQAARHQDQPSENFPVDILSDASGVSIHRFQMAVWTVIMGLVFFSSVMRDLSMPQFSENLLMLMGISSGSYVALKLPENKSAAPAATDAAAEPPPVG